MARYVNAGPSAGLAIINPNAFLASNQDFYAMRINQAYDMSTELGQQLAAQALQRNEAMNGFAALQTAKAVADQIRGMIGTADFKQLWSIEDFQTAPDMMVNWIMTDPTLRGYYHRGFIEGWSDTYVDIYPHETGEESTAYMLLNNGLFQDDEQNGWKYNNYNVDWGSVEPLTIGQVDFIKEAQERLRVLIEQAEEGSLDPTSQYGATL